VVGTVDNDARLWSIGTLDSVHESGAIVLTIMLTGIERLEVAPRLPLTKFRTPSEPCS
jgi:hypothetical protein